MTPETEVAVIGAGVIGLACAAALSRRGRSVIVLERHGSLGRETTTHNSEVIHAGIYYAPDSHKATLCAAGRAALYERCERLGIPHRRSGKIIVATDADETRLLEELLERGRANGAPQLELLSGDAVRRREPCVRAVAGLWSPASGIVDAAALCLSYAAEAEAAGAILSYRTEVTGIERTAGHYRLLARGADGVLDSLRCAALVNAAGLESDRVAALAGLDVDARGYRLHPCKGDYFALAPGAPLRIGGLVYPVPGQAGLGIHATRDLGGRIRLGPDAVYVERIDYDVDPAKAAHFARAAGRYLPGLEASWLTPDGAGVRPKLAREGEGFRDFVVAEESDAGLPGFVNLIGIESPGLTAAPAIAERVATLLGTI